MTTVLTPTQAKAEFVRTWKNNVPCRECGAGELHLDYPNKPCTILDRTKNVLLPIMEGRNNASPHDN